MFTGIVEELGRIDAVEWPTGVREEAAVLTVYGPTVAADLAPGDSVAVDGVCLTVLAPGPGTHAGPGDGRFLVDVMRETLDRSTLSGASPGAAVNLERAVTLATRLGGHLVQGHVDATGTIVERRRTPRWDVVRVSMPSRLARYIVEKGSIAVDGVSLTVVSAGAGEFSVSLIPTTLERTTLGRKDAGERVNLEVDVMAKYAERLLLAHRTTSVGGEQR